ncbi:hypothetical protein [Agromyces bauzanensis]|uniref:Protein kinase domain-containing protein n=1 Tax=Agromyces bauzanensis TaxID=1308924 RepID=A0A917PL25_9MICO|nr:hypothetical protein [Agromyces bauzanensis]GGJ82533.1 hypothetical protein GCM10011372_21100 [Agromyces bauzanensis]
MRASCCTKVTSVATSSWAIMGTAAYISPEQARGEEVGPPTDVYFLGLVLLGGLRDVIRSMILDGRGKRGRRRGRRGTGRRRALSRHGEARIGLGAARTSAVANA